jgi:hypothetical protein
MSGLEVGLKSMKLGEKSRFIIAPKYVILYIKYLKPILLKN